MTRRCSPVFLFFCITHSDRPGSEPVHFLYSSPIDGSDSDRSTCVRQDKWAGAGARFLAHSCARTPSGIRSAWPGLGGGRYDRSRQGWDQLIFLRNQRAQEYGVHRPLLWTEVCTVFLQKFRQCSTAPARYIMEKL